jgi:uncharacterized membrane protein YhaH (DUF805 family)
MTQLAVSTFVWVFLLVPLIVVWVIGLVDIVRRDSSRQAKAGWIIVVLLLPFVGTLVYFLLRKPTEREIRLGRDASEESRREQPASLGPRPPVN